MRQGVALRAERSPHRFLVMRESRMNTGDFIMRGIETLEVSYLMCSINFEENSRFPI